VHFFDPVADSADLIADVIHSHFKQDPQYRLKKRVRHEFRWDAIVRTRLVPLIEDAASVG
jgi:hypothetical protein